MLDFRLLGVLEVVRDGAEVALAGPKERAILAILLLDQGVVVSTDRLIDGLWGAHPPSTALHAVQVYISRFRKLFGPGVLETHAGGYRIVTSRESIDIFRFEAAWRRGLDALGADDPTTAIGLITEALAEWRGDALQDFSFEDFASADAARLAEMRLHALEDLAEAKLRGGKNSSLLVSELEPIVRVNPTRERLRGALMLALYRSGRHADALAAYREFRALLAAELGLEPSPGLRNLERRILNHEPTLLSVDDDGEAIALTEPAPAGDPLTALAAQRRVLVVGQSSAIDSLAEIAIALCAGEADREAIVAQLLPCDQTEQLAAVTARLAFLRARLAPCGLPIRVVAFTSDDPAADAARLAKQEDIDLVLCDGRATLRGDDSRIGIPDHLVAGAPCDAGLTVWPGGPETLQVGLGVVVPFGGSEHDWAALELGAWIAAGHNTPLLVAGVSQSGMARDSSRLLADASLALQRHCGVLAEPVLISPGADELLKLAANHGVLIAGLPRDWRKRGLGETRYQIATSDAVPAVFVRRGSRPGVLAGRTDATTFRWSIAKPSAAPR
jgi:DNA-binding SARP family transcriptional activator